MSTSEYASSLAAVESAAAAGKFTAQTAAATVAHLRKWLTDPAYAPYAPLVAQHVAEAKWRELDDVFWTVIPFGTGGRRGRMYPIGTNAVNDRTIGESAQGLADYVRRTCGDANLSCAIAYDTRHRSPDFARLCAEIMTANGFKVFFLDGHRSTPELSFAVRQKQCSCGIMVTASHNPPSDNAVKVYWSTGGQLVPPHDEGVIRCVYDVQMIVRGDFDAALAAGQIVKCQDEIDRAYVAAAAAQALGGPRELKILYSPLHGVGATAVVPVLAAAGFKQVEVFGPHAEPSGDFPNVPGHVSNPENPAVFSAMIEHAQRTGAELVLASDPDCDRIGVAAPRTKNLAGPWGTLTGNQIGALLADYILETRKGTGRLASQQYLVKTLVTTDLIRRIGRSYGVTTYSNLHVGFKWIAHEMDVRGAGNFIFGAEESHGYLVGEYARDKDGGVAALLMAELAAKLKARGQTLHEKLDALFWQHGYHLERTTSVTLPGAEGMTKMVALMQAFRTSPPKQLGGLAVTAVRDYQARTIQRASQAVQPMDAPPGDMVILELEPAGRGDELAGNYVAVRPSGTEPKVKYYMFAHEPAEQLANLDDAREHLEKRLAAVERDLKQLGA